MTNRSELRRIGALFGPYRARLFSVLGLIALSAALSMISPFLLREVLDHAIPERDTTVLTWLVLGMIAIAIITGGLGVAQTLLSNMVGQQVMHDLRTAVFATCSASRSPSSRGRAPARSSRASPTTSAACRAS